MANPNTGRGFRARLHGRLWLLCLAACAVALGWQAWVMPRLLANLPPMPGMAPFWIAMLLSALLLGTSLFLLLRRLRPGRDDELAAQLRRQQQELQALAGRLIDLQETERRMLSRELHDDIGQAITAIKLGVMSIDGESAPVREEIVREVVGLADQTIAKLRDISMLLRPPQLDALGLEAALRWQSERLFRAAPAELELRLDALQDRADPAVELACFRIAQEALTNVLRHADARQVTLTLSRQEGGLMLHVLDDGRGVAPDRIDGLGLLTMRERAQLLGGHFDIETEPGAGTSVRAWLPLKPQAQ
ncbi:sensor histidine kinase [Lysobacter niastensis]